MILMSSQEIIGIQCKDCITKSFPKRLFCPNCRSMNLSAWTVPSKGVIYSFTIVNFPIDRYEDAPYYVGLISVGSTNKPLITAQIKVDDANKIKIGQNVTLSVNNNFGPFNRSIVLASIDD